MPCRRFVLALTSSLVLGVPAVAQPVLNVPGPLYPTIQSAINAALPGATVLVAPGTYPGSINFSGKAITVRGAQGAAGTILVGTSTQPVVTFASGEGPLSVLSDLTVTAGNGGVRIVGASPTILRCVITGNHAYSQSSLSSGGGVSCSASGTAVVSPALIDCVISNNWVSGEGGGIAVVVGSQASGSPTLIGCTIATNTSYTVGFGVRGGGLAFVATLPGLLSPTLDHCVIAGNVTQGPGGGGFFENTQTTILFCTFRDNFASNDGGGNSGGSLNIVGSTITRNTALIRGGGLSGYGGTIQSCTIAGNQAPIGGGLSWSGGIIVNTIVWGNTPVDLLPASPPGTSITYCNIGGGVYGGHPSNLSVDPRFVDAAGGDFHLASSSPCRGAGNNAVIGLPLTDMDGTPRIVGGVIDLGADEIPPSALPGSGEDLDLYGSVDGAGDPLASSRSAPPFSLVTLRFVSPGGTFTGLWPLGLAQLHATGAPLPPNPGLGEVHVFLGAPFVPVFGSLTPPPFPSPGLPSGGVALTFQVPAGLAGTSLRAQGFVLTPQAGNGLYAATAAQDVDF